MVIDLVFIRFDSLGTTKDNIIYIVNTLKSRGYKIRVFLAYETQCNMLNDIIDEVYFYGLSNILGDYDKVNLAFGYRKMIENIGIPDIVLASNDGVASCICRTALMDLEDDLPSIISLVYKEINNSELEDLIKSSDAYFVTSETIASNIYNYSNSKAIIYNLGNIFDKSIVNLNNIVSKLEALFLKYLKKKIDIFKMIETSIQNRDLENAMNLISEYDIRFKNDIEFINMKAVLAINMEEYEIAINILEHSELILKEINIDLYYNLAYAYCKSSNWDKSIEKYKCILEFVDKNEKIEVHRLINNVYMEREKEFKEFCSQENILNSDNYDKTILYDTFDKDIDRLPKSIYDSRKNINEIISTDGPEVSICVFAYNKLEEYTKNCVESILKYTIDIDYELILVDNGSTDGTYEYFKTIKYDKKKIIKITKNFGASYLASISFKEMNGKYLVFVTNDVVVTNNWLSNMLTCVKSNNKIGIVHPGCDYAPLEYKVDLEYKDLEDMQRKAKIYNISNPRKWYEVFNLYTVATLYTRECLDTVGISDYGYVHHAADVDMLFRARRAGYKAIICKDTFITHVGKATDKGELLESIGGQKGVEFFKEKFFLDLDDVNGCENNLINLMKLDYIEEREYDILGIDTKFGQTILEMKNIIREKVGFNSNLYSFSEDAKYWLDLKTISKDVYIDHIDSINKYYKSEKFDYIVLCKHINLYTQPYEVLEDIIGMLKDNGTILLKVKNSYDVKNFLHIISGYIDSEKHNTKIIDLNILSKVIQKYSFYIDEISAVETNIDENFRQEIDSVLESMTISSRSKEYIYKNLKTNIYIDEYNLKLKKLSTEELE
ncbi:glycosyltransferase [Clostridioides difficile]|uniref:glycosyltransferase n=1 Tax=Clostridioides difficile TaxID=1496 RepID=UPI00093CCEF1|nr:glycosyltransferase [Clostridioides difficile]AXU73994.1 glycosyl transferase family protein [Clostridioides difficile]VHY46999.1 glycosyl transferase family protein [Clostridioides difficile]HAT4372503.1 glycosyltransferase [Clostridioides difficile]HBF4261108.1 glycosyltransferase [Clostridioides difficile]HBG5054585.1 glycosyltransferase [Clostridioides difficile]